MQCGQFTSVGRRPSCFLDVLQLPVLGFLSESKFYFFKKRRMMASSIFSGCYLFQLRKFERSGSLLKLLPVRVLWESN